MAIKQLTIFVENKQGALVSITDTLSKHNINLRALSIAETPDFGILRLIVNDEKTAEKILAEEEENPVQEEIKIKPMWQIQKESWYEKLPLNLKQLDTIIVVALILLVITFVVIFLDAADIFNPFGY